MDDVVRARIGAKIKKSANAVLKEIGLTPSDAFRLMMKRIAVEKKLPFTPLDPNATTKAAMRAARRGEGLKVGSVNELMKELNSK